MMIILRHLISIPKACRDALLAPAEDPRQAFDATCQRHQEWSRKVCPDLSQLRDALRSGFSSINSDVGLKALQDLVNESEQLQPVLGRRKETDPLSVAQIPALAEETYRQGLSVLEDSLELARAIHLPDRARLEAEVVQLEEEIECLGGDESQAARIKMRKETVASNKELLDMILQQQLRVDELLHQSERCQASLHRTRIELAALRAGSSEGSVSAVTETLRKTISQAREVQEEMKKLGF